MGKGYFKFKQFTVFQDQCGMKVCTDSCLFGSLIELEDSNNVLDVGTGTGLLSLMIAQKTFAPIIAIEPDLQAFRQAVSNVANSPFRNITVLNTKLQNYAAIETCRFDLIICNPPFYTNYLKSSDTKYNSATHTDTLPLEDLVNSVEQLLSNKGRFWVILPPFEFSHFMKLAPLGRLYLNKSITLFDRPGAKPIRFIGVFSKYQLDVTNLDVYIKSDEDIYSEQFKSLLSNYYLNF